MRAALPDRLALFALPGALLLPRGRLPLTLFEPRYLQLLEDVLKTRERLIGMIQPQGEGLARIGTAGRVAGFQELDDGRVLIQLKAISRYTVATVEEGFAPYPHARVSWDGFEADRNPAPQEDTGFDREAFLRHLRRYLATQELATDWDALDEAGDEMLVNALSMALPFGVEEKQALLEAATLTDRRVLLDGLMEYALRAGTGEGEEVMQ